MALLLSRAILHTVGNQPIQTHYSDVELDIDSEACVEFVSKHVRRLLHNPGAKEAVFMEQSPVYDLVKRFQKGELHFKDMSRQLCQRLSNIMEGCEDIPPADVLVVFFESGKKSYIALIKLNYGECFTHRLTADEKGGKENQIIKNTAVLPLSGGKVEEACLIPYDPMVLRILEKPHQMNGESVFYFSSLFLECETQMSKKEAAQSIQEIADQVNAEFFHRSLETAAQLKTALLQEAENVEETDGLILENVVRRAFGEREDVQQAFMARAKDYRLPHQVMLDKPFIQREFKVQRFKADNGVELKFPSSLIQDPEQMQMCVNPDKSVTITLKNLRPL